MASQKTAQAFTYYNRDGTVEVVEDQPLHGTGRAWTTGIYRPPAFPSALNVLVSDPGIRVWTLIRWLRFYDGDVEKVLAAYAPTLTRQDMDAAIAYYEKNKSEIDEKLAEYSGAA